MNSIASGYTNTYTNLNKIKNFPFKSDGNECPNGTNDWNNYNYHSYDSNNGFYSEYNQVDYRNSGYQGEYPAKRFKTDDQPIQYSMKNEYSDYNTEIYNTETAQNYNGYWNSKKNIQVINVTNSVATISPCTSNSMKKV